MQLPAAQICTHDLQTVVLESDGFDRLSNACSAEVSNTDRVVGSSIPPRPTIISTNIQLFATSQNHILPAVVSFDSVQLCTTVYNISTVQSPDVVALHTHLRCHWCRVLADVHWLMDRRSSGSSRFINVTLTTITAYCSAQTTRTVKRTKFETRGMWVVRTAAENRSEK